MKPVKFIGTSKDDLRSFPEIARRKAGFELFEVQKGSMPSDFKPVDTVGKGVYEIRIRTEQAHRIFYVSRFEDAVYVLHAFEKKTPRTAPKDIEAGRRRYQEMLKHRTALGPGGGR